MHGENVDARAASPRSKHRSTRRGETSSAGGNGSPAAAFDYFLFEQRFRGPVAEIKRRQRSRSIVMAVLLIGFAALVFAISIAKMGMYGQ